MAVMRFWRVGGTAGCMLDYTRLAQRVRSYMEDFSSFPLAPALFRSGVSIAVNERIRFNVNFYIFFLDLLYFYNEFPS
jgi:hypothetical protein